LLGDAAAAVSFLAGQGSSLAMTAAYVLAGELSRNPGDPAGGFRAYERQLRPLIEAKQRGALYFGGAFAPRTRLGLGFRNAVIGLMRHPRIARWALGREIRDNIELPDYEPPESTPSPI
jgi:2-polyprenyl-6-methoxyphenol hydroxylase-like FAD-dependent oxidoreductase